MADRVPFGSLKPGARFAGPVGPCLKMMPIPLAGGGHVNAVELETGRPFALLDGDSVRPIRKR